MGRAVARFLAVVRRRRHHFVRDGGPHGGSVAGERQPLAPLARGHGARCAYAVCGDGGAGALDDAAVLASVARVARRQCAGHTRHQPSGNSFVASRQPAAGAPVRLAVAAGTRHRADAGAGAGLARRAPLRRVDGARAPDVEFLLGIVRHGMAAGTTRMAAALGGRAGLATAADGLAVQPAVGPDVDHGL